jgi:predicted aminopeptidase
MRISRVLRILVAVSSLGIIPALASCSPGYVMRGAYEQGKILLGRRDIKEVLQDPDVPDEDRAKLKLVLEAREYASSIGLKIGGSFTTYSDIGKDTLSWIVVGARKDSFTLYTWWFPIVGEVPYKGFFDHEDAQDQARELEAEGYETWVRGTDAFSTLGWFDDPVLSTTLKSPPTRISNTVIHESVHATVWIPGSVPFNESLANFVGNTANEQFFAQRVAACAAQEGKDCTLEQNMLTAARRDTAVQLDLSAGVEGLYSALAALYKDPSLTSEQKVAQRATVFDTHILPLRAKYPTLQALQRVNNAEIMQLRIYLTGLDLFKALYEQQGRDWGRFFAEIGQIKSQSESGERRDPFAALKDKVGAPA